MPPPSGAPVPAGVARLFEQGRAANLAGRPAEAERLLQQALQRLDKARARDSPSREEDPFPSVGDGPAGALEAWVRVKLALSTALLERKGSAAAVRAAREALASAQKVWPSDVGQALVALCHSQLGMVHGQSGRPRAALAELDLAATQMDSLGPSERFPILINRGYLRLDVPDTPGAAADFTAATELAAEHGLVRQEFMARHNLALAALQAGDLPRALSLMLQADQLSTDVSRAAAWHGRGLVLLEAGLVVEAVELLGRATEAAIDDGQELQAGQSLVDLAQGQLLLADTDAALATAERAAHVLARAGAPALRRRAVLVQLSARLLAGKAPGRVARQCVSLAHEFDHDGDNVAADLARLVAAEALTLGGRHTEAVELLARSVDLAKVGSLSVRMRTRSVLAAAARAAGDLPAARRHVRAALRDMAGALHGSGSLELRAVMIQHAQSLARLDLELAGDRPAARLAAVERWNEVALRAPSVRPPADPELARRVTVLRHLRQQVNDDPGRAGELRQRLRSLERQVASASWSTAGGADDGATAVEPGRVRDELARRRGTAVVYAVDGDRLCAAVVTPRRTRWVDLGPIAVVVEAAQRLASDLEARTRVADGPLVTVVEAASASSARSVDDLVLRPLGVDGRLVVVPVPALAGLAWGMLPSRAGQPTTVAPSLGSWVRGARELTSPRAASLAGPGLPGSLSECASVASIWQTSAPSAYARAEDLSEKFATTELIHVAAHGSHRSDSPLFSSLWLEDGPVFLADLERVEGTASHMVVSACEAGHDRVRGGGASLGLASGLLSLGVDSVVASPCRVPDATASDVMHRYHRLLADGTQVDEALASAAAACDLPLAGAFVAWGSPWSVRPPPRV